MVRKPNGRHRAEIDRKARPARARPRGSRLKTNRELAGLLVHAAGGGVSDPVPRLSAGLGVWLSFTDARIGRAGVFVGLENYEWLWDDSTFWLSVFNTLLYTTVASTIKFAVGLYLALLLNEQLPFKAIIRAIVLIPFIVPTVLSAIAFWWLFDPQFSIISWSLRKMRPDHRQYRFPRRRLECALVGDLRQYLARRAVRRDHAAGRAADGVALALRGGHHRRRHALADASASSPIRC